MKKQNKILGMSIISLLMVFIFTACSGEKAVNTVNTESNTNISLEERALEIVAREHFEGDTEGLYTTTLSNGMILVEVALDMGSGLPTVVDGYIVDNEKIVVSMWDANNEYSQKFDNLLDEFGLYDNDFSEEVVQGGTADNYVDYIAMIISQITESKLPPATYDFLVDNYDMFFSPYGDVETGKAMAQPILKNDILKNVSRYNDTLFKTTMEIIEIEEISLDNGDTLTYVTGFIIDTYMQVLMIGETKDNVRNGTKVNVYGVPVSKERAPNGMNIINVVAFDIHHQLDGIIN